MGQGPAVDSVFQVQYCTENSSRVCLSVVPGFLEFTIARLPAPTKSTKKAHKIAMMTTREQRLDNARISLERVRQQAPRYRFGRERSAARVEIHEDESENEDESETNNDSLPWTPHLKVLLCGTRDEHSPLALLCGNEDTVLKEIYTRIIELWKQAVIITKPAYSVGRMNYPFGHNGHVIIERGAVHCLGREEGDRPEISFTRCGHIEFPQPNNRNVNMLPFIMGDALSLPEDLQVYYDSAIARCPIDPSELGKVCYLTVTESFVKVGETQRRDGLHIEAPGSVKTGASFQAATEHRWGTGVAYSPDELRGGIFMSSSVDRSCKVWNALVKDPTAVDSLGGVESLRPFIGEGYALAANELVWMTDKTPHEALPQEEDGYRQYFRLVTSEISVWFVDHSTPNPQVPLPSFVKVIHGNKFETKG